MEFWILPAFVLALVLTWPVWRRVLAQTRPVRTAPEVADQPDRISLHRVGDPSWRHPRTHELAARQLGAAGFVESGAWTVRGMPDLLLALHAHPAERAYAVIYDHPHSEAWVEFVTRYDDGTLANYTTLEPVDVEIPEGSIHVAAPHLSVDELWKRMLAERPTRPMRECSRANAARDFERGYADSVAHHKRTQSAHELPGEDVQQVA